MDTDTDHDPMPLMLMRNIGSCHGRGMFQSGIGKLFGIKYQLQNRILFIERAL
jgi:hypothetical protein